MQKHRVKNEGALLAYVAAAFPQYAKAKLKQLLKYGAITVNGAVVRQFNHALKRGDELCLLDRGIGSAHSKFPLRFPIVYEDETIIVIDKPEGLLTMGTDDEKRKTAYWKVGEYLKAKGVPGKSLFIVHRLDRDASGLIVFARTEEAKHKLQTTWEKAEKKYYAIVAGAPAEAEGKVESWLKENKMNRMYSTKRSPDAQHAVTRYRVVATKGPLSLIDVTLMTGRKNQIRVHMADLGCPIIGDEKYGSKANPAKRLGLHASYLALVHPVTGKRMEFKSNLPEILKQTFFEAGRRGAAKRIR